MELNSQRARFFLFVIFSQTLISLIYDTIFNPLSDTLFEYFNRDWSEIQSWDRTGVFRKSVFEFLNRLASTPNTAALQSRKKSVHKNARQEVDGFTYLLKTYISSVKDADLNEEKILDSLTLLSWYIQRFWKSHVRHIFAATKLVAETGGFIFKTPHITYTPTPQSQ